MKPANFLSLRRSARAALRVTAVVIAGAWAGQVVANGLADAPLFTASSTSIRPNLMFIMDDSGSMQWDFMPDAADVMSRRHYGRSSAQCNGLAFDPKQVYTPAYDIDGSGNPVSRGDAPIVDWTTANPAMQTRNQLPVSKIATSPAIAVNNIVPVTLTGAGLFYDNSLPAYQAMDTVTVFKDASNYFIGHVDRESVSGGNQTLNVKITFVQGTIPTGTVTSWKVGHGEPVPGEYYEYTASTKQPRLTWYNGDGTQKTSGTFYTECMTLVSGTSTAFTKRVVAALDVKEQQNYANWAKYYRSRMEAMQSSVSVAFRNVDDRYRVGYSTISQPSAKTGDDDFLHVSDFTSTQKKSFYTQLYAAQPGDSNTPLRGALAKAGQYFAKKAKNQDKDPIQFSCQRNFSILSTDGYWNTGASRGVESVANEYGPYKFDRKTAVGNVDNVLPRPMADGNTLKSTTTENWSTILEGEFATKTGTELVQSTEKSKTATGTVREERRTVTSRGNSCGSNKWRRVTTVQKKLYTGTREQAQITEVRTPTVRTVVVKRTQQTDHVRTLVVDNGATIADYTNDTVRASVDTPVSDTTATEPASAPILLAPTDVTTVGAGGNWQVVSTNGPGGDPSTCLNFNGTTTAGPTTNFAITNFGAETTTALADRTEALSPKADWLTTPKSTDTEKLVDTKYESKNGQSDTLADVAAFYYENDLRSTALNNCNNDDGKNVCANNVPGTPLKDPYKSFGDAARTQHMTTFTVGMGVSGSLNFDPNYVGMRSGDFHDIVNLGRNWPNTTAFSYTTVDDLWHAAVNGRGQYFSAGNPAALTAGLSTALAAIDTVIGSASAASTSSLQPVAGDNDIFVAQFTTKEWIGDVLAYEIDPNTGRIPTTIKWSAKTALEGLAPADRKILYNSAKTGKLEDFTYDNLSGDSLVTAHFDKFCSLTGAGGATAPSQCATMSTDNLALSNDGKNLVEYLRGDQTKAYYRKRTARLGDIINASPLFVGKPAFKYTENDYAGFASGKVGRKAVVLAAANDGMLHAFDRADGKELWAFIPSAVIPELHKLADENFANAHQYFVDGSPQMGDVWDATASKWRTIVVGGLNKGGRAYYALDVTNPEKPEILWEFSADNLGYTFGNPIITKLKDKTWAVVFGSGYENVSDGNGYVGDGNGRLFVIDALTKAEIVPGGIPTLDSKGDPIGTEAKPSGLARINSWVDKEDDNTSLRFYAGDELGNLWRFDIDGNVLPNKAALRLAEFSIADEGGTMQPQPITTKPAVALNGYNGLEYPVVYVGTGSYMRRDDSKNKLVQTVYAIKDPMNNTAYGDVRTRSDMVVQKITDGVDSKDSPTRTSTAEKVDWSTKIGWRADFPVGGERVSVNPQLALDTLYVGTNLPKDEDCSVGGDSFLYQFNIATGQSTGTYIGNVLVQGLTLVQLTTGSSAGSVVTIITRSDGTLQTDVGAPPTVVGNLRRTSWRELVD